MSKANSFQDYVRFSTNELDAGHMPPRCSVCGANPSVFEYRKPADPRSEHEESGSCCTACAFNLLLQMANEEASAWAALAEHRS